MSFNPKSSARMAAKTEKELLAIVESGSLSHAAARVELKARGAGAVLIALDLNTRNRRQVSVDVPVEVLVTAMLLTADTIGEP